MIIKVNTKIGNSAFQFEIEEKNEMDALHKSIVLSNIPHYCHVCQNKEYFRLDSNKDKEGNTYVNVICKCGAKAKLGQYKTGGYFWHKFEMYVKPESQSSNNVTPVKPVAPVQQKPIKPDNEDVPFDIPDEVGSW